MTATEIVKALGGRWSTGGAMARCPAHSDRSPSLSITVRDGKILLHCFAGCSRAAVTDALRRLGIWTDRGDRQHEPTDAEKEKLLQQQADRDRARERSAAFTDKLWRTTWVSASPARGSLVENWLRARSIALDPAVLDLMPLRWHPRCPMHKSTAPAMIAPMTDPVTGEMVGIHRTYLTPDGNAKAFGKDSRKMLGRAGIIRLSPDDEVTEGLGVGEGIETCLSVMAAGWRPLWAAGSLDMLKKFPVLPGVKALTIFADPKAHEVAGALACAYRWGAAGREVTLRIPHGGDWNDVLVIT